MIITPIEIFDMIAMTAIVGYIFMGFFRRQTPHDYLNPRRFDWDSFKIACWITAPALIFHELAHKFVAVSFGFDATFHAAYTFLAIGVILRLVGSNFIFFVPAFVSIGCKTGICRIPPLQSAIIAASGPFTNLAIFAVAFFVLKYKKDLDKKTKTILHLTKIINLFLFIFNMLPIPGFDGSKVFSGLFAFF